MSLRWKSVSELSRLYAKEYIKFLSDNNMSLSSRDAYEMFRVSINVVYNIETGYKKSFKGFDAWLEVLKGIKSECGDLWFISTEDVIKCSCVYVLVMIQYCSGNIKIRSIEEEV